MTFNANFLRGHPSTIIFHNKKISQKKRLSRRSHPAIPDNPTLPVNHQMAQIGSESSDWQIWASGNGEWISHRLVTFDRDRHFFRDAIELTEMQHFSFYKFKKQPASICLGIWDQIVKVVRWLQNKSSVELSSE